MKIVTSKIWLFCRREPEDEILFPEMPSEEEVGAEEGRILWDVSDGDVKVSALLDGGLERLNWLKHLDLDIFLRTPAVARFESSNLGSLMDCSTKSAIAAGCEANYC
jgi:hypothetical protein